jgi:hypothetical protein
VQSFFEWFPNHVQPEDCWIILGKGPSFALRERYDLAAHRLLGLNHVVREQPVLIAHMIDADVVDACGDAIVRNAGMLAMPWYPHVNNQPGARTLAELVAESPVLGRLDAEGRLLWYDLSTGPALRGDGPTVEATYFSAEAALNLLVHAGARRVRTLGVDGGSSYSTDFDDLRGRTLLANGRPSFDLQFEGFARTILRTGVDFAPLNLPSPVRVYVPSTPADALPVAVLQHSIRRHASLTVEVVPLPKGADAVRTGAGTALVVAPATQCLADIRRLFGTEIGAAEVLVPASGSSAPVRLALISSGAESELATLARLVRTGTAVNTLPTALSAPVRQGLAPRWSPTARYERGRTPFLWYQNDGTRPWLSRVHPLGHLWMGDLLDGVARGLIGTEFVLEEIRRGHVRPSLGYQLEHEILEPLLLPRRARLLDRGFQPPSAGPARRRIVVASPFALARAIGRQAERQAREFRARRRLRRSATDARVDATRPATMVLGGARPVVPR